MSREFGPFSFPSETGELLFQCEMDSELLGSHRSTRSLQASCCLPLHIPCSSLVESLLEASAKSQGPDLHHKKKKKDSVG